MKNIFKKNHIIITALAIMIVIAGYLSFTNNDTPDNDELTVTADPDTDELFAETEGMDVATTTDTDTTTTDEDLADDTTVTDDTTTDDTTTTDTTDTTTDTTDETTTDTDAETTTDTEAADELGDSDISDEDLLADAQDVSDNGELDLEDGVPGEAVLASAGIDSSFFISSKIDREQTRARSKETLMEIIESPDVSEEVKKDAIDSMIELTRIAEKENSAEVMLGAKGFEDAVVYISDGKVNVVVNAQTLTDQQLAIVEDVVKDQTGIAVKNIQIVPTVVTE